MKDFTFLAPQWIGLMALPITWWLLQFRLEAKQRKDLRQYCDIGSRPWLDIQKQKRSQKKWNQLIPIAMLMACIGTMRPGWSPQPEPLTEDGRDIVFVLDVSKSMLAEDMRPSRLEMAKTAISKSLDAFPGDRHALLAFAGSPSIRSPLTEDRSFLSKALQETDPYSVAQGGTRIEDALYKVIDKLLPQGKEQQTSNGERNSNAGASSDDRENQALSHDQPPKNKDIILITDGDDLGPFPKRSIELINQKGIRIIILGLGNSQSGARIPTENGYLIYKGREVWTKHQPDYLQNLSEKFEQGIYFNIGVESFNLKKMIQQLRQHWPGEQRSIGEKWVYQEGSHYAYLLSAILLALGLVQPFRRKANTETPKLGTHLISLSSLVLSTLFIEQPSWANAISDTASNTSLTKTSGRSNTTTPSIHEEEVSEPVVLSPQELKLHELSERYQHQPSPDLAWDMGTLQMELGLHAEASHSYSSAAELSKDEAFIQAAYHNAALGFIQQAHDAENIDPNILEEMIANEEMPLPPSYFYEQAMDLFRLILRHDPNDLRSSKHLSWCHLQIYGDADDSDDDNNENDQQEQPEGEQQEQQQNSDQQQEQDDSGDQEQDGDPSDRQQENSQNSDQASDGAQAMQSGALDLPPPAANPEDLIKMQQEQQLFRKQATKSKPSKVEKDW